MNQMTYNAPAQAPQEESGDRLRKLHIMLTGRYPYAVILAILGIVAGGWGGYRMVTPVYQSVGAVQVHQFLDTVVPGDEEEQIRNLNSYIHAQINMLTNADIVNGALDSQIWKERGRPMNPVMFVEAVTTEYTTRRSRNEEIFNVAFTDPDQHVAQAGLEALLTTYAQWHKAKDNDRKMEKVRILRNHLDTMKRELNDLFEQMRLIAPRGTAGIESEAAATNAKLIELATRLNDLRAQRDNMESLPASEQQLNAPTVDGLVDQILALGDPRMHRLVNARDQARSELELHLNYGGPNHPRTKVARAALQTAQDAVYRYAEQFPPELLKAPLLDPAQIDEEIARTQSAYDALEQNSVGLAQTRAQLARLERSVEAKNLHIERITAEIDSNLRAENLGNHRVTVINEGSLPTEPHNASQRKQFTVLGGAFGGTLGFGIILLIGAMDRRLRDSEDVRWTTGGAGLLGVLPKLPKDLADPEQAAIASHCVHHIRALLQLNDRGEPRRIFSITSPASGTGKTSLTLALALSFAESGSRTLLIDCDLFGGQLSARVNAIVRRRIGQILKKSGRITEAQLADAVERSRQTRKQIGETLVDMGLLSEGELADALDTQADTRVGLLDAIGGEDFAQCVAQTGFNDLWILPIGQAQPHDAGRLSPTTIRNLFTEALKYFDVILVDTGPIPASLEASVVATEADGVVLTVSRGEQRPLAVKAKKHLESIGAHVAGVVFNRADNREVDSYSYRPRSISGEPVLPGNGRAKANLDRKGDQRTATYGPIAQAVSLSAPPDTNGKTHNNGNGSTSNGNGRAHDHVYEQETVYEDDAAYDND